MTMHRRSVFAAIAAALGLPLLGSRVLRRQRFKKASWYCGLCREEVPRPADGVSFKPCSNCGAWMVLYTGPHPRAAVIAGPLTAREKVPTLG